MHLFSIALLLGSVIHKKSFDFFFAKPLQMWMKINKEFKREMAMLTKNKHETSQSLAETSG